MQDVCVIIEHFFGFISDNNGWNVLDIYDRASPIIQSIARMIMTANQKPLPQPPEDESPDDAMLNC